MKIHLPWPVRQQRIIMPRLMILSSNRERATFLFDCPPKSEGFSPSAWRTCWRYLLRGDIVDDPPPLASEAAKNHPASLDDSSKQSGTCTFPLPAEKRELQIERLANLLEVSFQRAHRAGTPSNRDAQHGKPTLENGRRSLPFSKQSGMCNIPVRLPET